MKHVAFWVGWWLALFWLWLLLAGEWNTEELVAAATAATISATIAEFARARTGFSARVPLRALADVPPVLLAVVVDFGIVVWALGASLVRRRVVRGSFVRRDVHREADVRGVGPRAWATLASTYSANAYPLDVDPATGEVLLHDLVPRTSSERPL